MEQVITFEDRWGDVYALETNRQSCEDCALKDDDRSCQDAGLACMTHNGVWVKD